MSRALALLAVLVLATACATRSSSHRLQTDVASLRSEVNDLRQAQDTTARDLLRATAETRSLQARLGEVAAAQNGAAEEVRQLRERVLAAETSLREATARATPTPTSTPAPAAPATPPPAAPATPTPPTPRPGPTPARPREPAAGAQTPEQAYQAALATFRAHEYGQAVLDFLDFKAKHPRHPLAANAQYWIGEAYYVQRDYRQAMIEFQKVLDTAPDSRKVPDAILKMGYCYRGMRDESRARQTWDRVAKDYPRSEAAVKARALLDGKPTAARR